MPRGVKGSGKAKDTASKRPYHRKAKAVDAPVAAAPKSTPEEKWCGDCVYCRCSYEGAQTLPHC